MSTSPGNDLMRTFAPMVATALAVLSGGGSAFAESPAEFEFAPIMPSAFFASLMNDDASAIAHSRQRIPPIKNKVPDPADPGDKAEACYMTMVDPTAPGN